MRESPVFVHVANTMRSEPLKKASLYISQEIDKESDTEEIFVSDAKKIHELFERSLPGETLRQLRNLMMPEISTNLLKAEIRRREQEQKWKKYPEHHRMMTLDSTKGDMVILQAIENRISRGYFGEDDDQRTKDRRFLRERGIDIRSIEIEKRVMLTEEME